MIQPTPHTPTTAATHPIPQAIPTDKPILLFDGVCNLCNSSVQFIIRHDPKGIFRFAALQSDVGKQLLQQANMSPDSIHTVVLYESGTFYTHSDAPLRVVRHLRGAWPLLYGLVLIPRFIRDAIYRWIARHRYRWFGQRASCMIPTPDLRARFISF